MYAALMEARSRFGIGNAGRCGQQSKPFKKMKIFVNLSRILALAVLFTNCNPSDKAKPLKDMNQSFTEQGEILAYMDHSLMRTTHPGEIAVLNNKIHEQERRTAVLADKYGSDRETALSIADHVRSMKLRKLIEENRKMQQ